MKVTIVIEPITVDVPDKEKVDYDNAPDDSKKDFIMDLIRDEVYLPEFVDMSKVKVEMI